MTVQVQICTNNSVKVEANLILICCMCECMCRIQTSSGERKCEQVNPLLVGLQHHMEVSQPLVVLDTRYHIDLA